MAQSIFDIDLVFSDMPLMAATQGRTIINPAQRETRNPVQVAYCHNVMPTAYGYQSIGYVSKVASENPGVSRFRQAFVIQSLTKNRIHMGIDSYRTLYYLLPGAITWVQASVTTPSVTTTADNFDANSITVATVNGVSYIYFSGIGCFAFDETTNTFVPRALTGLTAASLLGVVESSGYLIAYSEDAIAWSSTINPQDFVPSPTTGAGGGNIQEIRGKILFCTSLRTGILIYTENNVVSATYTGNKDFPWRFREVSGASGGQLIDMTTYDSTSGEHIAYTKAGMQILGLSEARSSFGAITDFIESNVYEFLENATDDHYSYPDSNLGQNLNSRTKLVLISNRYLIISFGYYGSDSSRTIFSYAFVYDLVLEKWGKLKFTHVDIFEYVDAQDNIAKKSIAMVAPDGEISLIEFELTKQVNQAGVLVLGKLQDRSGRLLTVHKVELESYSPRTGHPTTSISANVYLQTSIDGSSFTVTQPTVNEGVNLGSTPHYTSGPDSSYENMAEFRFRATGKSQAVVIEGGFNLSSLRVTYSRAGRR